jgi:hypothetical protein
MDDEHENLIMNKALNQLASLVSSLNLGNEEMHVEILAIGKRKYC